MTPTRTQLDAVPPSVPAGISAMTGDLSEPDEEGSDRAKALDWLMEINRRAMEEDWELIIRAVQIAAETPTWDLMAYRGPWANEEDLVRQLTELHARLSELQRRDSAPERHESDETGREAPQDHPEPSAGTQGSNDERWAWWVKLRAAGVPVVDFDPPRKGTHESDLDCHGPYHIAGQHTIVAGVVYDDDDIAADEEAFEFNTARDWSRTPDAEEAK